MSRLFASGGQNIGALASTSVLPVNTQGWFPLGLTGLISLQSKGLSRVFSSTIIWNHQFFSTQPPYGPTLTSVRDYWKNHSFDFTDFFQHVPQSYSGWGGFVWVCWWLSFGFEIMVRMSRELLMHTEISCFRNWWPSMMWLGTSGTSGLPGHCLESPLQGYCTAQIQEWALKG